MTRLLKFSIKLVNTEGIIYGWVIGTVKNIFVTETKLKDKSSHLEWQLFLIR